MKMRCTQAAIRVYTKHHTSQSGAPRQLVECKLSVSSAPTFSDFAVQNLEVVFDHKTYGNEKKNWILPFLSWHKPNKNMKNAVKSRFFCFNDVSNENKSNIRFYS